MTHICVCCRRRLPWNRRFFYRNCSQPHGLSPTCKDCLKRRARETVGADVAFMHSRLGYWIRGALFAYAFVLHGRLRGNPAERNEVCEYVCGGVRKGVAG